MSTRPLSTRPLSTRPRARRGFTLAEIVVSLVILGVIGTALVRLIMYQARFSEGQMALRNARTVSRNAMNIMLTDLRMVQDDGGLVAASRDSITVRVPVAFGLLCSTAAGATMSLLPVDSAMMALAQYAGWAYRDSTTGSYSYRNAGTPLPINSIPGGATTLCTDSIAGPGVLPLTYGTRTSRVVTVPDGPSGSPKPGWPVFLYQQITYQFGTSGTFNGRRGLYRKVKANGLNATITDEIIAPFDTSAKFRFYVLNADTAQSATPTDLNTVRGLQLVLAGSSPRQRQTGSSSNSQNGSQSGNQNGPGNGSPSSAQAPQGALVTGVFFKNRRDP